MIFQKNLKAGIFLQCLLLAMFFSLFFQFYVYKVDTAKKQLEKSIHLHHAAIMSELTKQNYTNEVGEIIYDKGSCSYILEKNYLKVHVKLINGNVYYFKYLK